MKLLHLQPNDDIDDAIDLLEENGIPTCVSHARGGALLYVCLPHQHEDAQRLLADPDHVVRDPVDAQAFRDLLDRQSVAPFLRLTVPLLAALLLFFGLAWYVRA